MDRVKRIVNAILRPVYQPAMRLTRGQTLGARCAVLDGEDRVLLIRHSYAPGWGFPGGGVERGETLIEAAARELDEEAGVVLEEEPVLHGIFANFEHFPGDHVALFIARRWRQDKVPAANLEIIEQRFFGRSEWPETATTATRQRLAEMFEGAPLSRHW